MSLVPLASKHGFLVQGYAHLKVGRLVQGKVGSWQARATNPRYNINPFLLKIATWKVALGAVARFLLLPLCFVPAHPPAALFFGMHAVVDSAWPWALTDLQLAWPGARAHFSAGGTLALMFLVHLHPNTASWFRTKYVSGSTLFRLRLNNANHDVLDAPTPYFHVN